MAKKGILLLLMKRKSLASALTKLFVAQDKEIGVILPKVTINAWVNQQPQ